MHNLLILAAAVSGAAQAPPPADGVITLRNANGMTVRLLPQGAIVMAIEAPDRQGRMANVVLGYLQAADYRTKVKKNGFGATIGRYAGRIANARFAIDGTTVNLVANDGRNALHGGGFGASTRSTGRRREAATDARRPSPWSAPMASRTFPAG